MARSSRDIPPSHYTLKIDSFSQLLRILSDTGRENYESDMFEASGYRWKLSLFPNGDKEQNGEGHISLYLVMAETESLPVGWEVKVSFKLFMFQKVHDTYLIFEDNNGKVRHLNESKTELGFAKLLPLSVFKDPSNGFLTGDKCAFGVEVFVLNYSGKGECLTLPENVDATHTWRIGNFSSLQKECYDSGFFSLANRTWVVKINPKGESTSKGKFVSLGLELNDTEVKGRAYVKYRLRLRDQFNGMHDEIEETDLFTEYESGRVFRKFVTWKFVKDTLIVEFVVISISSVKNFSQR